MDQAAIIRNARTAKRLTQDHLAGAAGVSKRTVIRVEQGRPVSSESIMALCNALGLDASEVPVPIVQDKRTADAVLGDMIRSAGETVIWTGTPDPEQWKRDNAIDIWGRYGWIVWLGLPISVAMICWALTMQMKLHSEGYGTDMTSTGVLTLLSVAVLLMEIRFFGMMRLRHSEADKMADMFHVLTEKALYIATRITHPWHLIHDEKEHGPVLGTVRRIALPDDRSCTRERSLYVVWPKAKVLIVKDVDGAEVSLSGIGDPTALAGRIRHGLPTAA